jgi:hypothetical protein
MEYFLERLWGELEMPGVELTLQTLELCCGGCPFGLSLAQLISAVCVPGRGFKNNTPVLGVMCGTYGLYVPVPPRGCEPLRVFVYCIVEKPVIYWTYISCKIEC